MASIVLQSSGIGVNSTNNSNSAAITLNPTTAGSTLIVFTAVQGSMNTGMSCNVNTSGTFTRWWQDFQIPGFLSFISYNAGAGATNLTLNNGTTQFSGPVGVIEIGGLTSNGYKTNTIINTTTANTWGSPTLITTNTCITLSFVYQGTDKTNTFAVTTPGYSPISGPNITGGNIIDPQFDVLFLATGGDRVPGSYTANGTITTSLQYYAIEFAFQTSNTVSILNSYVYVNMLD